ncbi:hypothetical protein [Brucella pituitosa]|uniref:hypothetical protein n=1 Tax=Brucella pituitosa TaxID=571256 RepID=UPI0012602197|nr:hypothetical protein [Brucella pituitosa]
MYFLSLFADRKADVPKERIVAVAMNLGSLIVTLPAPARHNDLMTAIFRDLQQMTDSDQEGFLTSEGRFVSRREARGIAVAAGQVGGDCRVLISQHLW